MILTGCCRKKIRRMYMCHTSLAYSNKTCICICIKGLFIYIELFIFAGYYAVQTRTVDTRQMNRSACARMSHGLG